MKSIRILLAHTDDSICQLIQDVVETTDDLELVAKVKSLEATLKATRVFEPEIVVIGDNSNYQNGVELVSHLQAERVDCKILVISDEIDRSIIHNMLSSGISGYIRKDVSYETMPDIFKTLVVGKPVFSVDIARILLSL